MKKIFIIPFLLLLTEAFPQKISSEKADMWARSQMPALFTEHREFVRIPCDANYPEDMKRNADWLNEAFSKRGFTVENLEAGAVPVVLATMEIKKNLPWVLFYLHYDGQPVDPTKWDQEDPFDPVIKDGDGNVVDYENMGDWKAEWRIYGRAAADDKGPIMMFLHSMDILKEQKIKPSFNIKVMLDGQEEQGSYGLRSTLEKYREKYKADRLVIMDGPAHTSNQPTLTFGCRGSSSASLTVYGPKTPQHSGHFGNYAPNPAFRMAKLLASMKDEDGRVVIPGFYDGVEMTDQVRELLASVPDDQEEFYRRLGIAQADQVGKNYQEALQYPTLNVKGMQSGWVGEQTRTIIPESATVQLGIRLVVESDGKRLQDLVGKHIEEQGYYVIDREPTDEERRTYPKIATYIPGRVTPAFRTEWDSPMGTWMTSALKKIYNQDPVRIRTMGGTVPISPIIDELGMPAVILPLVNMDNNQHSPNENLRAGNIVNGMKSCLGLLTEKF